MKLVGFITLVAVAVAIVATTVAGAAPTATKPTANAALLEFEGTVVSVNRATRTFRLRDSERGTVRIKVTRNTRFERINGLRGLRAGMRNIESVVRRSTTTAGVTTARPSRRHPLTYRSPARRGSVVR
jgi:hypothetical protein